MKIDDALQDIRARVVTGVNEATAAFIIQIFHLVADVTKASVMEALDQRPPPSIDLRTLLPAHEHTPLPRRALPSRRRASAPSHAQRRDKEEINKAHEEVLADVIAHPGSQRRHVVERTGRTPAEVQHALLSACKKGQLRVEGTRRRARYYPGAA